jgi:hypothetical protein
MFHVEHFCTIWRTAARFRNERASAFALFVPAALLGAPQTPEIDVDPTVLILYPPDQPIAKASRILVNQPK